MAVSAIPPKFGRWMGLAPWFGGLIGRFGSKPSGRVAGDASVDALFVFPSEGAPRSKSVPIADVAAETAPRAPRQIAPVLVRLMLIVAAVAVLAGVAVLAIRRFPLPTFTAAPRAGNLSIETRPVSSEVLVDGQRRGVTPLTLSLTPGAHTITVRSGSDERVVPLTIAAGAEVSQYFEMKAGEPAALLGRVSVATDPPGARVAIDGRPRGTSPLTVADLTAEEHTVTATNGTGSAERKVVVTGGGTASVLFSLSKVAPGPVGGWLSIAAPFEVEVVEDADVIGTSGASRIMLAAGRHNITLTNRTLGFQEARKIEVTAGKTLAIRIDAPKVPASVNARPWADITLDGESVGQTPLANLLMSVGPHEMVFKHPQLGERRQTVVVTSKGPNRISVDLTK